jgi:N-acetylmuramoyl-L-alanine amidase
MKKILGLLGIVVTVALLCILATGCNGDGTTTNPQIPGIGSTSDTTGTTDTTDTTATTATTTATTATTKATTNASTSSKASTASTASTAGTTGTTGTTATTVDPSKLVIFLDPGHGGNDPGTTKNYDFDGTGTQFEMTTYKESDINLAVALKAKAKLEALGYNVILSRTGDTYLKPEERPEAALKANAAMFISIHVNSFNGDAAKGFEAYYSAKSNLGYDAKAFAELFTKEFEKMKDIPNSNKPEEPAYPNMTIRGTKADTELYTNGLAVLNQKESQMPSTLLELGFLSNEKDAFMLQSTYWQNFAAEAIADAVVAAHIAGLYKG